MVELSPWKRSHISFLDPYYLALDIQMENTTNMSSCIGNITFDALQNSTLNETATDTNSTQTTILSSSFIALSIIMIFFGLVAIAGNSVIILCVIQYRSLRTTTNLLIANLAVADFLNGCSWVICSAMMTFSDCIKIPTVSYIPNDTKAVITLLSFLANNFAVLLIALERFICIHFALRYHSIVTSHRTAFILTLTWMFAVMCFTAPVEQLRNTIMPSVGLSCTIGIVVFYSYVGYVACKKSTQSIPQPQVLDGRTAEALDNQKTQWKVTKFLTLVFGVYLGSVLLCTILMAFNAKRNIYDCSPTPLPIIFGVSCWGINNCVNPFLYVWKSEQFRKCVKKRLGIKRREVVS